MEPLSPVAVENGTIEGTLAWQTWLSPALPFSPIPLLKTFKLHS